MQLKKNTVKKLRAMLYIFICSFSMSFMHTTDCFVLLFVLDFKTEILIQTYHKNIDYYI